jgi:PIN domain nuclease of toxin-antitoxin system
VSTLLLDTHAALWMVAEPERLGVTTRSALGRSDNRVLVSAASVWEAGIKEALGKLRVPESLWDEVERCGVEIVSIDRADAVCAARLPPHHGDTFDRMLVAQAIERGAVVVSADARLAHYDVRVLPAHL